MVPPRAPSLGGSIRFLDLAFKQVSLSNRGGTHGSHASPLLRGLDSFLALAFKQVSLSFYEPRLDRELHCREPHRVAGQVLRHSGELAHHSTRLDDGDPVLRRAFAGAHAGFGRLLRHGLVGKDIDPDLAASLDMAGHGDTGSLDLAIRHPAGLERLETEVAEVHLLLALGHASHASALLLAELGLLRQQHQLLDSSSPELSSFVGSSTCCFGVVVSGASSTGAGTVSTSGSTAGCSRPSAETPCSSVRGCSTERRLPPPRRPWRTGPRPSRSGDRRRPPSADAPRPSPRARPPRRRA